MDALVGLLNAPRARGAFVLRSILEPPWSLRIQDEAPLTLVAMVRGDAWVVPDDGDAEHLVAGDVEWRIAVAADQLPARRHHHPCSGRAGGIQQPVRPQHRVQTTSGG